LSYVGTATAQSSGGTIAGTVVDPSGAVVPNAGVTATGADTGSVYNTVTTSAGVFRFPEMQLGRYNIKVVAAGFTTQNLEGILVTTGSVAPVEVHLSAGGSSTSITVNDSAPVVETENSEVSNTVSSRQIVELPLSLAGQSAMRSVESFIFLAPGTVGPGTAGSTSGAFQSKTSGGQNFGTEELLDGISVRRLDSDSAFDEHAPSVEALVELKVTTSIIPATEGRTSGGVENFTTKGGTNKYHGTAFDIFQNEDLNANTYFNKLYLSEGSSNPASLQRPIDKKNDYGGSVGGPIVFPHLYNGRDKTFGFFSWEQFRQSQSGVAISAVPTSAVRGGDFSAQLTTTPDGSTVDCAGNPVFVGAILDPATTATVFNPTLNATVACRNPFPGNVIPSSRFSSTATTILKYLPLPNQGVPGQTTQNYSYSSSYPTLNTNYTIRIDQNLSDRSKLFVTYTDRDNDIRNGQPPYPGPGGGVQLQHAFQKYLRFGSDYTVSATSFNHFVVGLNRLFQFNRAASVGFTPDFDSLLGIRGASGPDFPAITWASTYVPTYNSLGYNNDSIQPVSTLEATDTYSFILGRHTLNIGLDWRKDQFSNEDKGSNSGTLGFAQFETADAPSNTATGDGFASLLLGRVDTGSIGLQSRAPRFGQAYYAAFIQDDYKITHNLLLNIGLRYDIDKPRNEAHGDLSNFSPTLPNAAAGGLPGELYFAGSGAGRIGGSGEFADTWKKDFAPRIGFAYAPDMYKGSTSIRGGFGIYYAPLDYSDFGAASLLGFSANPNFHNTDNFNQAFCDGMALQGTTTVCNNTSGLDQGFPGFALPPNLDPTQNLEQDLGGQLNAEYIAKRYGRPAQVFNWGLQVQQQLATDLIFTLGYIGTSASYLHSDLQQLNDLNPSNFSLGQKTLSSAATTVPFAGFSGSQAQALRPFPQYGNIFSGGGLENLGHSSYEALTAKLERRFHSGLNILAAYTWSKTLTDADSTLPAFSAFDGAAGSVQNPYNLKGEKSLSFQDTPQNFVLSYIYELPVGKGKKFFNHSSVVNAIAGGYQVGGIQRYLSGQPTAFACTNNQTPVPATLACLRYDIAPQFVNHGAGANDKNPLTRQAFNIAAFTNPSNVPGDPNAPFVLGTSPRVNGGFRSPLYKNEDFSIIKHIANFGVYGDLQLHVDLFDAFNRTHFNGPSTDPNDLPSPSNPQGHFGSTTGAFGDPSKRQFILRYTF
jgi:hypothetical protein